MSYELKVVYNFQCLMYSIGCTGTERTQPKLRFYCFFFYFALWNLV